MAEAKKTGVIKQVAKTIIEEALVETVELKLSMDEAKTLAAILRRVGGPPEFIRGESDKIAEALREAIGVWHADDTKGHLEGSIFFGKITPDDLRKSTFY